MKLHRPKSAFTEPKELVSLHRVPGVFCPVRDVLDRVGDQWSFLVVCSLVGGTRRFGELKKGIGDISPRVLTQTLRNLEQDGLVTRKMFATIPPRVDYTITELGRSLVAAMQPLIDWAAQHRVPIQRARQKQAKSAGSNQRASLQVPGNTSLRKS